MRHPSSRILRSAGVVALLALPVLGAACGDDDDDSTASETDVSPAAVTLGTSAAAPTTAGSATGGATTAGGGTATTAGGAGTSGTGAEPMGDATVMVAETDLGEILVDGEGRTLYLFTPDEQGPSTCTADCLANWPSLTGPAAAGEGVDESLLGTAARPDDGSEQVTYNGWPLYYFAADPNPGDINGQGVGDIWFVVDPAGEAVPAG